MDCGRVILQRIGISCCCLMVVGGSGRGGVTTLCVVLARPSHGGHDNPIMSLDVGDFVMGSVLMVFMFYTEGNIICIYNDLPLLAMKEITECSSRCVCIS